MDGCHLKDTLCQSGIQTSIYEGKESILRRGAEKQKQAREPHNHSQMLTAYCIPETMRGWSSDQNSRPEWEQLLLIQKGFGVGRAVR